VPEGPDGLTGGKVAASRPEVVGGKKIFLVNKMADRPEGLLKIGLSPILIKDDHFSLSSLCARVRHGRTGERRKPYLSQNAQRAQRLHIFSLSAAAEEDRNEKAAQRCRALWPKVPRAGSRKSASQRFF